MFEPGTQVGRYEIQRRLGRGGMGAVYVAHDPVLGRMVAIKVFSGDLDVPDARERFSREARAAAALSHPSIVTVFDFGEYEAQPYIVMEYVAGETLAGFIRRKTPVAMADKLRWMEELCEGAKYAHQMQLVHRDIKPANLMIDRSGRLKILDFGIARMLGIASNTSVMIGTPGYMAPEQITGEPVDHRADQFAIGVVFYELLAYTEAFPGDTLPMITHRILQEQPVALSRLAPDAPPEIIDIIERTMRKNAAERFPDSESLRLAIARARREFSSNAAWNAPTVITNRDITPPGTPAPTRGTGSARRRQDDAIGVAQLTPPPDPTKRSEREAIARRRTAQLEASMQEARRLLALGELDAALDACQQALTFDEHHLGAIQLEGEIETALRQREDAERDSAMTAAVGDFGLEAELTVLPSEAVTRLDPPPVPPSAPPVEADMERTVLRLPVANPDATIIAPPRRTPAPTSPPRSTSAPSATPPLPGAPPPPRVTPPPATPAPPPRVTRSTGAPAAPPVALPASAPPVTMPLAKAPVPPSPPSSPKSVPAAKRAPAAGSTMNDWAARLSGAFAGKTPADRSLLLKIGAGVAALVLIAAAIFMFTGGPVATGTLVIDATPWAAVASVQAENGENVTLPANASTPLALPLPAGNYQVTLTGPPPESESRQITVRVDADGMTTVPLQRFRQLTPEEYFEQFLTPQSAPVAPVSTPEGAAPVSSAAPEGDGR